MTIEINDALRDELLAHAAECQPREACGVLVKGRDSALTIGGLAYWPIPNLASDRDQFRMDPRALAAAEDACEIVAIVHSHPHASANPSIADRVECEKSGLPWIIVGWPSGAVRQLEPLGWQAPYQGREFVHGVVDCYTLLQDYYRRELGIVLPDIEREDGWWEGRPDHPAQDLYMEHLAAAGFVRVYGQPQQHDGILMQILSPKANHGAVYLGDGRMLHHPYGRLSEVTVYGGSWARHTVAIARHISLIEPSEAAAIALPAAA